MAIVIFEHSPSTGALRLGAALRDYGHQLRVFSLHEGDQLPVDLDDVDGVVSCGGSQSITDHQPWLDAEMDYLRAASDAALPIVGVCLGSQILAKALGGEVGSVQGGIELGWHDVCLTDVGREDIVYSGIAWESMQLHWHREQVTVVPPGARVLARSERCAIQAWALELRTYGLQYHPEIYPETIETWAAQEPQALAEAGVTLQQLRDQTDKHYPAFARLSQRLFESIAFFLMPADRRIEGAVKDLHH